jgi:hypothetical protein
MVMDCSVGDASLLLVEVSRMVCNVVAAPEDEAGTQGAAGQRPMGCGGLPATFPLQIAVPARVKNSEGLTGAATLPVRLNMCCCAGAEVGLGHWGVGGVGVWPVMGWATSGDPCCRPSVLLVGWPTGRFGCRLTRGWKIKSVSEPNLV